MSLVCRHLLNKLLTGGNEEVTQLRYNLNLRSTITDAASGVTTFGYNLAGQLTSIRDPENNDTT